MSHADPGSGSFELEQARAELEQARLELALSERRFRSLFETATSGLLVQSADGRILHANQLAASILGVTAEQLRGSSVAPPPGQVRWFAEDGSDLPAEVRPAQVARTTLKPVRGAVVGLEIEARELWIRIDSVPILSESGELEELINSFVDITELKQRERREARAREELAVIEAAHLAETEEQAQTFRSLYQLALAATGVLDGPALVTLATDTASRLLGGVSSALFWYDSDREVLKALADSSRRHSALTSQLPGEGAVGRAFITSKPVVVSPDSDPDPRLDGPDCKLLVAVPATAGDRTVGALMVRFDQERTISEFELDLLRLIASLVAPALESARLHTALRESELRQNAIVEAALDCIIATDAHGIITEFNPAAQGTFGYTAVQAVGRPITDLVDGDDSKLLKEEGPMPLVGLRTEGRGVRRDGSRFPIELVVTGLADAANPVILISVRDLSPRQMAEMARRESEAKSRFLATMSHELRTPLNSVLGFTQLLEAEQFGPLNERQRRYLRNIAGSGRHLLGLINDVLDLSKVQAGEMELNVEVFDLDEVVATALEQMLPQARAKGIQLGAHPEVGRRVSGDRRRVFQILLNLISNALKFTPEAGAVEVSGSSDGERVVVTVTDTGVGIPVELLDRIFDEFTQVESGTTRNQEGTGLGLALSRRLAELMGGSLEVASVPGRGSTFTLELPLMVAARKGS